MSFDTINIKKETISSFLESFKKGNPVILKKVFMQEDSTRKIGNFGEMVLDADLSISRSLEATQTSTGQKLKSTLILSVEKKIIRFL